MFDRVRWCEVLIMRVSELACKCAAKLNSEERVKGKGWEVNGYGDRTQPNPESRIPNPESRIPHFKNSDAQNIVRSILAPFF
jgi:hypothetical protein